MMKIVEVDWLDSLSDSGWKKKDYKLDPKDMLHHSTGYLLENSKKQIVICQSYGEYTDFTAERLQIPKGIIKKIKIIRSK